MRSFLPELVVAAALAGSACIPVVSFDVPLSAETTVEQASLFEEFLSLGFGDFASIELSTTEEFQNNDVRREQVTAARLTSLTLSIARPQGANFDWLDEIAFSVEADDLTQVDVANATIDDDTVVFSCDLEDVDLAPFVRAPTFAITTTTTARRPPQDTTVRVDMNFAIAAEVQ